MPVPPDETLPPAATGSAAVEELSVQDIAEQFRELGRRAKEEEEAAAGEGAEDDDDDEDGDGEEGAGEGVAGEGAADGQGGEGGKKKKKKKKKSKAGKAIDRLKAVASGQAPQELLDQIRDQMDPSEQKASDEEIQRALQAAKLMKLLEGQAALGNKSNSKALGEHKFWKTQPVPQMPTGSSSSVARIQDAEIQEGPIDPPKTPADVKQEPGALPAGFEWSLIDIKNDEQCKEVHLLLSENYVEDDDAMFRFKYSKEFLLWALTAPGYLPDWHIGVRVVKTGKLVAFISGIKVEIRVRANTFDSAEINFLCVHKKLRSKRLAPVLIKEVTRRVNLTNVWQAIYTAGVVLPTPIGTCRYYHRNLNPPKLVDIGFAALPRNSTMSRMIRQYAVPEQPRLPGFREMVAADVPQVGDLLRRFLARFDVAQTFGSDEEVMHWFISGQGREVDGKRVEQVTWAYVVEDPATRQITDMVSFYSLPSSIMKHPKHTELQAAYLFYYATDTIFQPSESSGSSGPSGAASSLTPKAKQALGERLNALVTDLMGVAKQAGFDVLNALTLMDNNLFLDEQKFGSGDGFLNYYLYNWNCAPVNGGIQGTRSKESSGVGVVML